MHSFQSGKLVNQGSYSSFQPEFINRVWELNHAGIINLLSQADRQLGRLDMFSEYIPDIDIFISMHVIKEATHSSKIEGTRTNIEEVIREMDAVLPEKRVDWLEVHNYINALQYAINKLDELPLSNRLIRGTHKILMKGARGEGMLPGQFRRSQNWIGGSNLGNADYIPPVYDSVPEYMSDLEKFIHRREIMLPDLIKIAIIHYQFETIHPFLDGNGRIGRLIIPLYLVSKKILRKPVLYISEFFEKNRQFYFYNLSQARKTNDLVNWISFFLKGISETAKNGIQTFDSILKLKDLTDKKIQLLGSRAPRAGKLIDYLYSKPILNAKKVVEVSRLSYPSSYKLIKDLVELGIITEVTGNKRDRSYIFSDYLEIFQK